LDKEKLYFMFTKVFMANLHGTIIIAIFKI